MFGGFDDWRLPSARDVHSGILCTGDVDRGCIGEIGHLLNDPPFGSGGGQGPIYYFQSNDKYAWAVRDGDVPASQRFDCRGCVIFNL